MGEASIPVRAGGGQLRLDDATTHVMAVVNLSPESRVRASVVAGPDEALARARACRQAGATIIDLGAQSSHYENRPLTPDEELGRLLPALERLVADGFCVSVDTWKPEVAAAAVEAGASIVNDTGGLQDPRMRDLVVRSGVGAVVMHIEGEHPLAVGHRDLGPDRPARVAAMLAERVRALRRAGAGPLLVDPGLSINYRSDYAAYGRFQLETIRRLDLLAATGAPVLVPVPRKAETHRMLAYLVLAVEAGAHVLRVHEVEAACDLVPYLGRRLGRIERD